VRTAYSGRAAAYEKKGDYEKALADHNMAVLFYAIEAEVLTNLDAPDRADFLAEAARAYRARGQCLEALGREKAAQAERRRADGLEADAKKLASAAPKRKEVTGGPIQVINAWTEPVTLVLGGVAYRLEVGEQKAIQASTASVAYEMFAGPYRKVGTMEAGKTYTIGLTAR
jgi:tetratricopeptide (TPR) repeat protein